MLMNCHSNLSKGLLITYLPTDGSNITKEGIFTMVRVDRPSNQIKEIGAIITTNDKRRNYMHVQEIFSKQIAHRASRFQNVTSPYENVASPKHVFHANWSILILK